MLGGKVSFTPNGNGLVRSESISVAAMKVDDYIAPHVAGG